MNSSNWNLKENYSLSLLQDFWWKYAMLTEIGTVSLMIYKVRIILQVVFFCGNGFGICFGVRHFAFGSRLRHAETLKRLAWEPQFSNKVATNERCLCEAPHFFLKVRAKHDS